MSKESVKTKTGRLSLGAVVGTHGAATFREDGLLASYRVRLAVDQVKRLVQLLAEAPRVPPGRMLAVTTENWNRIRIVARPLPRYEQRAARTHIRGDVIRVTGRDSLNIDATRRGADLLIQGLTDESARAREWIDFSASVVRATPTEGPRSLVEIAADTELAGALDAARIGTTGASLAEAVWPADDFSDWESPDD